MSGIPEWQKPDPNAPLEHPPKVAPINELREAAKELLSSPDFIAFLNQGKKVRRPPHTSKLSNFSYYREQFALEMKIQLDKMRETKCDIEWKFSSYPELKPNSLYQRVFQSLKYLLAELDFDGTYGKMREMMVLQRTKTGVRLSWIRDKLEGRAFAADIVNDKTFQWKEEVENFLSDETKKTLHLKNLCLTHQEQVDLSASFVGIKDIFHVITEKEIKIVKQSELNEDISTTP